MNDLLVLLLVLLSFGAIGALLVTAYRQAMREHDARALLALSRGWVYRGERSLARPLSFHFAGQHRAAPWSMHYVTEARGKQSTRTATWVADGLRAPQLAWLLVGRGRVRFEGGLGAQFLSGLLSLRLPGEAAGPDDRQAFISRARELPLPAPAAREFVLLALPGTTPPAIDHAFAQRLIDWPLARRPGVQGSRLRLSGGAGGLRLDRRTPGGFAAEHQVEIRRDSRGLQVVVHEMPPDTAACAHLIALGLALLDAHGASDAGAPGPVTTAAPS